MRAHHHEVGATLLNLLENRARRVTLTNGQIDFHVWSGVLARHAVEKRLTVGHVTPVRDDAEQRDGGIGGASHQVRVRYGDIGFAAAIERDDYLGKQCLRLHALEFQMVCPLAYRTTVCHSEPRPKKRSGISQATPTPSATRPAATRNTRLSASLSVSGSCAAPTVLTHRCSRSTVLPVPPKRSWRHSRAQTCSTPAQHQPVRPAARSAPR